MGNAVVAVKYLQQHSPKKADEFGTRISIDSSKAEEFKTLISKETTQRDLIIQRCVFNRYEEIDPIIENVVRTLPTGEVLEFFAKIYDFYAESEFLDNVKPFEATMLGAFIPHFENNGRR